MNFSDLICALPIFVTLACGPTAPAQPPLSFPVLTPDGAAIVFSSAHGDHCFLYQADIATGVTHRLTSVSDGCESDPAFSPDGQQLAFMRAPRPDAHAALMIAKADGTEPRTLVPGDSDDLKPVFVPHGNRIAFLRSGAFEHYSPVVRSNRHKFDVYLADLTTGTVTAVTHRKYYSIESLDVSPDSHQVLISSFEQDGQHLVGLPIDKPDTIALDVHPPAFAYVTNAAWLPDGRGLLFSGGVTPHPARSNS